MQPALTQQGVHNNSIRRGGVCASKQTITGGKMKLALKIFGGIVLFVAVVVAGGLTYLFTAFPKSEPAPQITIEATPERIERGRYLANHVSVCMDCHSTHDMKYYSGPIVPGTEGKGGEKFEEPGLGFVYVSNITPAALGSWTDGEILRAMIAGVNHKGEALAPMMPYALYRELSKEDAYSIVAYLRTLPPITNEIGEKKLKFPLNLIFRTIPQPADLKEEPNPADTLAYGKYLATVGGCHFCHTPQEKGQPLPGMDFAGGFEFNLPDGHMVRSANISPDENTGIGAWAREDFISRFKEYAQPAMRTIAVGESDGQTVMPWTMYAGMTEADLGAVYAYLRTAKPVQHEVERFPAKK
jgi:mono/diheme cytochrome c family protein